MTTIPTTPPPTPEPIDAAAGVASLEQVRALGEWLTGTLSYTAGQIVAALGVTGEDLEPAATALAARLGATVDNFVSGRP